MSLTLKKLSTAFILLFLPQVSLSATNPTLQEGINAFQQGRYDQAEKSFQNLMSAPEWKFAALYNLGNTAVRQNHLGQALGYYLRAARQNPHDRDTRENIKYVIGALGGRRLTSPPTNYDIFTNEVLDRLTFAEAMAGTFVFSIFFLLSLLRFLRGRKLDSTTAPPSTMLITLVILVLFTALSITKLIDTYTERGIVIVDHVDLRSGPSETNASMMEVAEGSEMSIRDSDHDWLQVNPVSGGLVGWIPRSSLMITSGGGPF